VIPPAPPSPPQTEFVSVKDGCFSIAGRPHRFVGANLWYAAYLGAEAPLGDRARLVRELDRLSSLGVTNLRILAASEDSPLRSAVRPAFHDKSGAWNERCLEGLDFALAEMKKRGQRAVLYLSNFWEWSGGLMTYLAWTNGGHFVDIDDSDDPWSKFADFAADFYVSPPAIAAYQEAVRRIVGRTNAVTGLPYSEDPTIFAWQIANEPRPGAAVEVIDRRIDAYCQFLANTARLIRSLAPHHLISTGSEGLAGCSYRRDDLKRAHDVPEIDYLTAHIWPQNWGWIETRSIPSTFARAEERAREYIDDHLALARELGRPLVIEEFGFPRDGVSYDPLSSTSFRDRFYGLIYEAALESALGGGPLSGTNFWAYGGEGRALRADFRPSPDDTAYLGDPPHEPQGWYSVFDTDIATCELIRAHAEALVTLGEI